MSVSTLLNGSITSGATIVPVDDVTVFPAGRFRVQVDSEIMLVTSITVSTNSLNVVRARGGTTAAAHGDDSVVTQVVTTEYIEAALKAKLVTALGSLATVVRPNQLEASDALPAVTYFVKNGNHHGRSLNTSGDEIQKAVFQVDGWSDRVAGYKDVKDIARAIAEDVADGGLDGNVGAWTYGDDDQWVWIHAVRVEDNLDDLAPPPFVTTDENKGIHAFSQNVIIVYDKPD